MLIRVYAVILSCFGVLIALVCYHNYENTQNTVVLSTNQIIMKKYKLIKDTIITKEFMAELFEIIQERKNCYEEEQGFNTRLSRCRKEYINRLIRFSREHIKSSPRLGDYLRCVRDCPISAALCNGEPYSNEQKCLERETQCIEYCLDQYWRGGTVPVERKTLH